MVSLLLVLSAAGCQEVRQAMNGIESAAIVAPTRSERQTNNVIPSADPVEMLAVTVEGERTLSHLASSLGAIVDDIMIDNQLDDSRVESGTVLQVRTTRSQLNRYIKHRRIRRLQATARAEARRAKKAAKRAKRRRRPVKRSKRSKRSKAPKATKRP